MDSTVFSLCIKHVASLSLVDSSYDLLGRYGSLMWIQSVWVINAAFCGTMISCGFRHSLRFSRRVRRCKATDFQSVAPFSDMTLVMSSTGSVKRNLNSGCEEGDCEELWLPTRRRSCALCTARRIRWASLMPPTPFKMQPDLLRGVTPTICFRRSRFWVRD